VADTSTTRTRLQVWDGRQWRDMPGVAEFQLSFERVCRPGFDVECDCGKASTNCTRKEDGTCD
jgi:hypothetical protein